MDGFSPRKAHRNALMLGGGLRVGEEGQLDCTSLYIRGGGQDMAEAQKRLKNSFWQSPKFVPKRGTPPLPHQTAKSETSLL